MAGSMIPAVANFSMLVGGLYVALKEPVRAMVRTRHENLKRDIDEVGVALKQAQAEHEEFSAKLKSLGAELEAMRADGWQEAKRMRERIAAESERLSAQIVSDAKQTEAALVGELRVGLRRELAEQVLGRADTLIRERLTGEQRAKIRQRLIAGDLSDAGVRS